MIGYLPEGMSHDARIGNIDSIDADFMKRACEQHIYLEAKPTLCDSEHNLHFDLGGIKAVMPREECAIGIADGTQRDIAIISRVNKLTGFYVTDCRPDVQGRQTFLLSRLERQRECLKNYISGLACGDVISARITRLESFGAFCDIGAGIIALLPVDGISVSRIPSPEARFENGQIIHAVVRNIDKNCRVLLSHKELLGTWQENASLFSAGETVTGIIRSTESYGVFVELTPNLAGLAEFTPYAVPGCTASVFIKSINPEKMKIKLIIVEAQNEQAQRTPPVYFITEGHIDRWQYSPPDSDRQICTVFD